MMRATNLIALLLPGALLLAGDSPVELGIAAFEQGRYAEASRYLEDAARREPNNEHARTFLALTRAATGRCGEAVPDLSARFAESKDTSLRRLAGLALTQCFVAQNELPKAISAV